MSDEAAVKLLRETADRYSDEAIRHNNMGSELIAEGREHLETRNRMRTLRNEYRAAADKLENQS